MLKIQTDVPLQTTKEVMNYIYQRSYNVEKYSVIKSCTWHWYGLMTK